VIAAGFAQVIYPIKHFLFTLAGANCPADRGSGGFFLRRFASAGFVSYVWLGLRRSGWLPGARDARNRRRRRRLNQPLKVFSVRAGC